MSNSYIIAPTVVDGIEFYVAPTGEAGMSIAGLARLCDVSKSTMHKQVDRRLRSLLSTENSGFQASADEEINVPAFAAAKGARIVPDDVCAEIIEHYAFESEHKTEKALFSYRKFARIGIRTWIHQVTGYAQSQDLARLAETMNLLLQEVKELRVETREYKAVRKQTEMREFVGLQDMIKDLAEADDDVKALPGGDKQGYYTVTEWLKTRGVTLDKSQLHRFAAMAAYTYRTMKQVDPLTVYRKSTQASRNKKMNGYLPGDFPILQVALTKTL